MKTRLEGGARTWSPVVAEGLAPRPPPAARVHRDRFERAQRARRSGEVVDLEVRIGTRRFEAVFGQAVDALGDAVTSEGLDRVLGPLFDFFAQGLAHATRPAGMPEAELVRLLEATLQGRAEATRLEDPAAQLAPLSDAQRAAWSAPLRRSHVRFAPGHRARFEARLEALRLVLAKLRASLGAHAALEAELAEAVDALRATRKGAGHRAAVTTARAAAHAVKRSAILQRLAEVTADDGPRGLDLTAGESASLAAGLAPPALAALTALLDTSMFEATTHETFDDPDLVTKHRLSTGQCVRWPSAEALADVIDANKRMIVARCETHGLVQGFLRIVEPVGRRRGEGPMLVMERIYPDGATDAKAAILAHAIARARDLGMPLALPEEYFIGPKGGLYGRIEPMNEVVEALAAEAGARLETGRIERVRARMGAAGKEYIDSAPVGGHRNRGRMGARRYASPKQVDYDNVFAVLTWPTPTA